MNNQLINQATQQLKPIKILLTHSNIRTTNETPLDEQPYTLESYKATSELSVHQSEQDTPRQYQYIYQYDVGIRGVNTAQEQHEHQSEPVFEITATYKIFYISEQELSEDCAIEFGKFNVGHNIWPYWREYVHSTCARIGLAPIEVPFYSISK